MSEENPFVAATRKAVYYPDELQDLGTVDLVSPEPVEAEEVPEDDAKHGDFVKVVHSMNGEASEAWIAAPRDLQRALADARAEPGHTFQVRDAERGDRAHSEWKFKVAHDPEQH